MASAGRVDHVVGLEVGNHVELSAPHVGRSHGAAGAADRHRDVVGRGAAIDLRDQDLDLELAIGIAVIDLERQISIRSGS